MAPTLQLGNLAATQGPALLNNRFLVLPSRCLCCKPKGSHGFSPNMFQFLQKGSGTSVKRWSLQGGALF